MQNSTDTLENTIAISYKVHIYSMTQQSYAEVFTQEKEKHMSTQTTVFKCSEQLYL